MGRPKPIVDYSAELEKSASSSKRKRDQASGSAGSSDPCPPLERKKKQRGTADPRPSEIVTIDSGEEPSSPVVNMGEHNEEEEREGKEEGEVPAGEQITPSGAHTDEPQTILAVRTSGQSEPPFTAPAGQPTTSTEATPTVSQMLGELTGDVDPLDRSLEEFADELPGMLEIDGDGGRGEEEKEEGVASNPPDSQRGSSQAAVHRNSRGSWSFSFTHKGTPFSRDEASCAGLVNRLGANGLIVPAVDRMLASSIYEKLAQQACQTMVTTNEIVAFYENKLRSLAGNEDKLVKLSKLVDQGKQRLAEKHLKLVEQREKIEELSTRISALRQMLGDTAASANRQLADLRTELEESYGVAAAGFLEQQVLLDQLGANFLELREAYYTLEDTHESEMKRLRLSRAARIALTRRETQVECTAKLEKLRRHVEDRDRADPVIQAYAQAKGTLDCVRIIMAEGGSVPAKLLEQLEADTEKYKAQFDELDITDLVPGDFVVEPPFNEHGTNLVQTAPGGVGTPTEVAPVPSGVPKA